MGLQIKRESDGGDHTSPSLWTILTSGLFARLWIGKSAPVLDCLSLDPGQNTLLYFRTRGCTICDLIDMQVASACQAAKVGLRIVDRYAKSDDAEAKAIYNEPTNILDWGGSVNSAYQIGVYPSLVLINAAGKIVLKDVGNKVKPEQMRQYLDKRFDELLS